MARHFLLAISILLLITSCTDPKADVQQEQVPWSEAGFLQPVPTKLTFINGSDGYADLSLDVRNYPVYLNDLAPDSLAPGERFEAIVKIHRPRLLFQSWGGRRLMRPVLPGKNRTLLFTGEEVKEKSAATLEYEYLDAVLIPLMPAGRMPPVIESIDDYQETVLAAGRALLDSVTIPEGLPDYLRPLLERTVNVHSYADAFQIRAYQKLFRMDTLPVPPVFVDSVRALLITADAYQTFQYPALHRWLAWYEGEVNYRAKQSYATNLSDALTGSFLGGYSAAGRRDDAVANYLHMEIAQPRSFLNKQRNIDTLLSTLPEAYQNKLNDIADEQARKVLAENDISDFLSTPLLTSSGDTVAPANLGSGALRLYKFWFAGCYPCLVQQPEEAELLADHPEVDLVYVAFNTERDYWPTYLARHQPPTDLHLYATLGQNELIRSAAGRLGAPTYVMTDAGGATICRPCPKPSDPLLREMIKSVPAER